LQSFMPESLYHATLYSVALHVAIII
jgi:hypothetical protein